MNTGTGADLAPLRWENPLTREFLDESRGPARAVDSNRPPFDRFRSWFTRPLLGRPALLEADEVRRLDHDLPLLLSALQSLPERLFDGDRAAFAEHLGWTGPALPELLRRLSGPAVPLGRADLVRSPDGFKTVEFNTSSSLGSFEFGELCRATLQDPDFAEFSERAGLDYLDPLRSMVDTLLEAGGRRPSDRPVIALVKWVTSPVAVDPSLFVDLMADLGFDLVTCRVDQLEYRGGALRCGGRRIDVLYRAFLLKTAAADPRAAQILEPVSRAVADGAIDLFSPLDADLYGTKSCLAMLSDPRHRDVFTAAEREAIDRTLPWTRRLADAVADVDGEAEPLLDHVAANRTELVLKPSIGHAGQGVVAGWLTDRDQWEADIRAAAAAGDHVVQRRARSVAERFYSPADPDTPAHYLLHWGLFVTGAGFSGGFVKGLPDRGQDVRFLGDGSHVGCVFHQRPNAPVEG
ncbi:hypothetical protein GCM10027447_18470 [Glycomyces halotolerans]